MGAFDFEEHLKSAEKKYFSARPWWVAKDTFADDWGPSWGQSIPLLSVPDIRINPPKEKKFSVPKEKKKQVALRLYSVTGKSIGQLYEIILLAENENKALAAAKSNCGIDADSCKEIEGPFLNGHILMMKYVNN